MRSSIGALVSLALAASLTLAACLGPRPTSSDGASDASSGGTGGQTVDGGAGLGGMAGAAPSGGTGGQAVDGGTGLGGARATGGTAGGIGGSGGGAPICSATQHLCGSACVANTSTDQCGSTCIRCTSPPGGTAACVSGSCTFDCGALKKCIAANLCVPVSGCCDNTDCPPSAGGQNGTCDTGTHTCNYACPSPSRACTVGNTTTCIAGSACCTSADCSGGACQRCDTTHSCVAALNQDDPTGRCTGTCDASGTCKAKQGQLCSSVAAGCISGTTCVDAYCCDGACTGACQACDVASALGKCSAVASGAPHGARSCGTSCAGSSFVAAAACNAGACGTPPAPQTCDGGFTCGTNVCKTTCASSGDCQPGYFCETGSCHLGAVKISSGDNYSCVLLRDTTMRCWGSSTSGSLGDPAHPAGSMAPVVVGGASTPLTAVASFSAGHQHACAVKTDGSLWCWGSNVDGELATSTITTTLGGLIATTTPTRVTGFPNGTTVVGVAGGFFHTCALLSDGSVWCWGANESGQLGNVTGAASGTTPVSYVPLKVAGLPSGRATAISAGLSESCAIMSDGSEWCWGSNTNATGSLGNGSGVASSITPVQVSGLTSVGGIPSVSQGNSFVCSTCAPGACCWGNGADGQLGSGAPSSTVPVTATGLSGAIGVTSGFTHACAWFTNGTGSCWGENQFGQLGNPVSNPVDNGSTVVTVGSKVPVAIHNPSGISFSSLSAGIWFTCGVATNGTAWCWGIEGPVLGNPSASTNTPVQVIGW